MDDDDDGDDDDESDDNDEHDDDDDDDDDDNDDRSMNILITYITFCYLISDEEHVQSSKQPRSPLS